MTKILGLILVGLFALGCDDEQVVAKIEQALLSGGVTARASCTVSAPFIPGHTACATQISSTPIDYLKMVDGSCLIQKGNDGHGFHDRLKVIDRTSADADTCRFVIDNSRGFTTFSVVDGEIEVVTEVTSFDGDCTGAPNTPQLVDEISIESECTGFNFEAFGVEP
jgi:hypothetical protein